MLVTETDAEAGLAFYYRFFLFSFSQLRKALFMVKPDLDLPDEAVRRSMELLATEVMPPFSAHAAATS